VATRAVAVEFRGRGRRWSGQVDAGTARRGYVRVGRTSLAVPLQLRAEAHLCPSNALVQNI
jgi:hypothetical protein